MMGVLALLTTLIAAPTDIDRAIERIRQAPPGERVKLMNALKKRLYRMNRQERRAAIERLRRSIGGGQSARHTPSTVSTYHPGNDLSNHTPMRRMGNAAGSPPYRPERPASPPSSPPGHPPGGGPPPGHGHPGGPMPHGHR
jgi:hypothetical protein